MKMIDETQSALRLELDKASGIRSKPAYAEALEVLRSLSAHSISILPDGNDRLDRFNCFAFALQIWEDPTFIEAVNARNDSAIVDSSVVSILMPHFAEVTESDVAPGHFALYLDGSEIKHAAVVTATKPITLTSKWGGNEIHRHGLWEVPFMYGDAVRFFATPVPSWTIDRLKQSGVL